jgi:hypothetical protein
VNSRTEISLINLLDVTIKNIPEIYSKYANDLISFELWVTNFLAKSNPGLGRSGAVCPYIQYAKEKSFFKVGIFEENHPSKSEVLGLIAQLKDLFINMPPTDDKDSRFKTITILFPNLTNGEVTEIIDGVQLTLKPEFVKQGLMIGQFHENCQQPGLRNANFRPLQSPIPLLAIRNMVETDWPFLEGDEILEHAYKAHFGQINFGAKKILD